jgi:propanol-preferring alcohol dehydrogenase
MGMRVIAVDGGDEKAEFCKELGAEAFIDFKKTPDVGARVHEITTHGAHAVIVFPAGKETYSAAPTYLRVGGTLVAIGLAPDPTAVAGAHPMLVIGNRLT